MKYFNIKRNKFSTIFKNINFKRYERILANVAEFVIFIIEYVFSRIYRNFNYIRHHFLKTYNKIDFKKYNFSRIYRYIEIRRYNFSKIFKFVDLKRLNFNKAYKYFDIRRLDFYKKSKKIILINYKYLSIYFVAFVIFIGLVYLIIPTFYSYDKSKIEKAICKNKNIECLIRGEVNYSFYPTPRIKIKDLVINDLLEKKNTLLIAKSVAIKLSIKNLLMKKKQNFKEIELNNFNTNIDLKNLKKYINIFTKKINFIPVTFTRGKIIFFDEKNYVATINDTDLDLIIQEDSKEAKLRGKFLNDNIYINFSRKKINNKLSTDIILKISNLNLLTKANYINSKNDKNILNGNILIKKDSHRFVGVFDYKNNEITINKSNLKNIFLNGKLEGKIKILPYFNFDLDLSLNSINFTKLYNHFLNLDDKNQKNLFRINRKINGKLGLSSDKIYSKYNLVKSFESRIKFHNGNILVEQFLLNLGKLGAADISGTINNDKKFTNFKYESNLFIDNQKKFLSKFGIYNKKSIPSSLFVSGNFDLQNIRSSFYEISDNEKLGNEDVNFIEEEFNDFMLTDGYENLFRFPKFVEFVKSITSEIN